MASYAKPLTAGLRTDADRAKKERDAFYSGNRWMDLRDRFLRKNPLCSRCKARGEIVEAALVHHVVDRLIDPKMAYSWTNLEAVCHSCHNKEHARRRSGPA
jgi:5-methylcytosine-specific restriction protein A